MKLMESGNLFTFTKLFQAYQIEVPILQRDYAQGRVDDKNKKVRSDFLKSIFNSLKDSRELKLDFVYGTINEQKFIPLDGQQRITTLFLIHWYYGNLSDFKGFTYKTRFSSSDFCKKLATINSQDILKQIPIPKEGSINTLSDAVRDQVWFSSIWEQDPTITGMLIMLDAIHEYKDKPQSINLDLIKFYFLELEGFKLTDDLYIKMNARGKHLNDYENFKAELLEHGDYFIYNGPKIKLNEIEVEPSDYFKIQLDTHLVDIFWVGQNADFHATEEFLKFLIVCAFIVDLNNEDEHSSEKLNDANKNKVFLSKVFTDRIEVYKKFRTKNKLNMYWVIKAIQNVHNCNILKEKVRLKFKDNDKRNNVSVFANIIYLLSQNNLDDKNSAIPIDSDNVKHWLDFVNRLIFATLRKDKNISQIDFMYFVKGFNEIWYSLYNKVSSSFSFYKQLSNYSIENEILNEQLKDWSNCKFFLAYLKEEVVKAKLRLLSEDWDKAISAAEMHPYFMGMVTTQLTYSYNKTFDWLNRYEHNQYNNSEFYNQYNSMHSSNIGDCFSIERFFYADEIIKHLLCEQILHNNEFPFLVERLLFATYNPIYTIVCKDDGHLRYKLLSKTKHSKRLLLTEIFSPFSTTINKDNSLLAVYILCSLFKKNLEFQNRIKVNDSQNLRIYEKFLDLELLSSLNESDWRFIMIKFLKHKNKQLDLSYLFSFDDNGRKIFIFQKSDKRNCVELRSYYFKILLSENNILPFDFSIKYFYYWRGHYPYLILKQNDSNHIDILYGFDNDKTSNFEFRLYGLDEADVDEFNKSHSNTNILVKPESEKFYKIFSSMNEDGDIINPAIELLIKLLPLYDKQQEALTTAPS